MAIDISSIASSLFGSASAETLFSAGQSASATPDQVSAKAIIGAHKREINRLRGYKLELTPIDKQRLAKLKEKIQIIEEKASKGTVRPDELEDRFEMLDEANRILGKPIVDVEADAKLAEYTALKVALLEPKLDNATAKRVAFLERFRDTIEEEITNNPERFSLRAKFQGIDGLIKTLKPLRATSELSLAERKTYDDIVELINDHTGIKLELTAVESDKVAALERSIVALQSSLEPDLSQEPTPQAVARAYISLSR